VDCSPDPIPILLSRLEERSFPSWFRDPPPPFGLFDPISFSPSTTFAFVSILCRPHYWVCTPVVNPSFSSCSTFFYRASAPPIPMRIPFSPCSPFLSPLCYLPLSLYSSRLTSPRHLPCLEMTFFLFFGFLLYKSPSPSFFLQLRCQRYRVALKKISVSLAFSSCPIFLSCDARLVLFFLCC